MAITVRELIKALSKVEDQDATVYFDEGAVFLDVGYAELVAMTDRDGNPVNHVVLG